MSNKRTIFSFFILCLISIFIIIRIGYMKFLIDYPYITTQQFSRGLILDRHGEYLAINKKSQSLFLHPDRLKPTEKLKKNIPILANILAISKNDLIKKINLDRKFIWIKRRIDDQQKVEKIKNLKIDGLNFKKEFIRYYPFESLLSHVLGFVGTENRGLEGLEYSFDHELNPKEKKEEKTIIYGNNIHLTIDINIQRIVEKNLKNFVKKYQANHALAIISKSNGEILALANYPDYNPNLFKKYNPSSYRNIAISNYYEPGSLFKIITAAILLENKLVDPEKKIYCSGKIDIYDRVIKDQAHGNLTLKEILQKSCSVNIIKLSSRISKTKMYFFLKSLKFGEKTNILLSGESTGYLKPLTQFNLITKSMISFGYEIGTTPIQLIQALNGLLNGGILYPVRLIKNINQDKTPLDKFKSTPKRVISEKTSQQLREMLTSVVKPGGTGYHPSYLQFKNIPILGKTGTVFIYDKNLNQYTKNIHAGFFGMLQLKTKDYISILIMINKPQEGGKTASKIAVPVFYSILKEIIDQDLFY